MIGIRLKSASFVLVVLSGSSALSQSIPYQSDEFNNPSSVIPSIFVCMYAGNKSGLDPAATDVALDWMFEMGISSELIDTWAHDATVFISQELTGEDWSKHYKTNCADQFANMRDFVSQ